MTDLPTNESVNEQRPPQPKRLMVVLALVALISVVAWVLSGDIGTQNAPVATDTTNAAAPNDTSNPGTISLTAVPASIVSKDELVSATKNLGFVIYWNGEMVDTNLELTVLTEGKVFVRYLPKDVAAGATEAYFTVATYYDPGAFGKVQNLGSTAGAKYVKYGGGAIAASASESDSNVYFAFEGNPALYNIYAPDPNVAWDGLTSGTIAILQ